MYTWERRYKKHTPRGQRVQQAQADAVRILAADCTGYLEKPIDPVTFMESIARHLREGAKRMNSKILVVDDLQENRYLLRALLEGHDFQVTEASNGRQALENARKVPPDAVISDLLMPEMDGFAFCREWMRDESLWRIPFIVYTATYTDPDDRQLVLDLGATDYIIKPVEPEVLVRALLQALDEAGKDTRERPTLQNENFYERYSNQLQKKLDRKVRQLAEADHQMIDYVMRCEAILDASPNAIISISTDLKIRAWNFAAERLFGYTESEAIGHSLELIIPVDRVTEAKEMLAYAREHKGIRRFETQRRHKDGTLLDVAISLTFLGPNIGFLDLISDLSSVRRAAEEKKSLQDQLEIARRMESVGRLAGGVAHDFNNLLTIILYYADFIESGLGAGYPNIDDAKKIREAGEHAASLTGQLLAFSRQQTIKAEVLNLNDSVRAIEEMLRRLIGEDIDLKINLARKLGRIEADTSQLEQVILNLAINARDAMPDGGQLVIETRNTVVDRREAAVNPPMYPGRYVILSATDTGIGMDEETRRHVFDPFFTTKERGRGTGLGLATVYGIVKQSKGFIWVYSEPGKGTTFKIYLPRVDLPVTSRTSAAAQTDARGQGETILVVEDDEMVRKLAQKILERAGFRVLEAANGREALVLVDNEETPVDLLLTDVVLPGMNGRELAERLSSIRPSMKVVFTSGYTDDALAHRGVLDSGVCRVEKPFSADALSGAVRAVLDDDKPIGEKQE